LSYTLDHFFIITAPDARVADALPDHGFVESASRRHRGQGSANRLFVLNGFALEFLFIEDAQEAATGAGKDLTLLERSMDPKACPFGIVVRTNNTSVTPDFAHRMYFADYLPEDVGFYVGENSRSLQEPLCICMPPELSARSEVNDKNAEKVLTELVISTPGNDHSEVLREFGKIDKITVQQEDTFNARLCFNKAKTATTLDLNPDAPLVLNW